MKLNQEISVILNKPMDRQIFLKYIAIGAVLQTGAGAAFRLLAPDNKPRVAAQMDYGGSAYGGSKEST